ncbi:hypothetical protein E2986_05217 [Frieseomelitta varia]|uniref:Ion transport domain-containing protein n=1 Tax=Frieseomelitta varia TaxID=561572 RepID=A0A833WAN8_9HYME|nr:hypothetical protein E2986_05217 [Frieseomelitta varia]
MFRQHSNFCRRYFIFQSFLYFGRLFTSKDRKNSWQSAEELRKYKDNNSREKQNTVWRHQMDEPKCNIQKENKMMGAAGQPPIITHTAATPQDSPNTTLDVGYRDLNCRAVYPTAALSIESIDRSGSQCSIPSGLLKLPDVSNRIPTKNLIAGQFPRRISLVTAVVNPSTRESSSSSPPRIQRGYSWKLSRPSLRRKRWSQTEDDPPGRATVLNNGRSTLLGSNPTFNGGYLHGSIRNDTQSDTPNNRTTVLASNNRSLSPNNSIGSRSSSIRRYTATPNQMRWISDLSRRNSLRGNENVQSPTRKTLPLDEMPMQCSAARTINNLSMETGPLPRIKRLPDPDDDNPRTDEQTPPLNGHGSASSIERIKKIFMFFEPKGCLKERDDYSLYLFPLNNRFRVLCRWLVDQKWFDNVVLFFIGLNCITLAMERPNIPPDSGERLFLSTANYIFTAVFAVEMFIKVVASGMLYGSDAYFTSGWNVMDGVLVIISIIDLSMSLLSSSSPRIFGILRVFRLLRSLRPLRVINRAPGLKLVVQTLLSSLRPIGNIVLICCTFFVIFGILGVQLFKGAFYYCEGPDIKNVRNKTDCLEDKRNVWLNRKYNFDDLGKALMSLFVLSSRDGWVNIMYTGLDAVGVDQQPIENYSEWRLLYFIAFILLVGFFVLNMFVGVVVENFHRCREEQEKEERVRRAAKRALQMEKKRRKMHEPPYYTNYSKSRLFVHNVVTSKYFDLAIAAVIGLNVVTMAMDPEAVENGERDTSPVGHGNAGVTAGREPGTTIFSALFHLRSPRRRAVRPFSDEMPCQGLGEHAHFSNFGMAFLTLFRVATGDNWNGIMKDTLRDDCDEAADCVKNCCVSTIIAPIFFVIFVLMAQFVLVNVVVAVLMKHLEESHKQMEDELDMETQLERELAAEQEELLEVEEEEEEEEIVKRKRDDDGGGVEEDDDVRERESILVTNEKIPASRPGLAKVRSLPANFIYNPPRERNADDGTIPVSLSRRSSYHRSSTRPSKFKSKRRQTFHSGHHQRRSLLPMHFEVAEVFEKPVSNLSVPRIIPQRSYGAATSRDTIHAQRLRLQASSDGQENKSLLTVSKPPASSSPVSPANSVTGLASPRQISERYLLPTATIYPSKATLCRRPSSSDTQSDVTASRTTGSSVANNGRVASRLMDDRRRVSAPPADDLDVQSIINERRPSKLKSGGGGGGGGGGGCLGEHAARSEDVSPMSTGNTSDSMIGGSASGSSASGSGSRNGSAVVHVPEITVIGPDVRIYVDDTDSTTSSNNRQRGRRSRNEVKMEMEEEEDASTSGSSVTAVPDANEETERSGGPSDPS